MRKLPAILFILGMLLNSLLFANPTSAVTIAQIQILDKPSLKKTTIANMAKVENIWTAGHYAWAVGADKIAFYNGHSWASAHQFTEWMALSNFSPLYPVEGQLPNAIISAIDRNHEMILQIFDGKKWHPSTSMHQILGLTDQHSSETCQIQTARGFAYLLCQIEDDLPESYFIYAVYNSKTDIWTKPEKIPGGYGSFITTADVNPKNGILYLLLATKQLYHGDTLVEISPDGSWTQKSLHVLDGNEIFVTQSNVFISYWGPMSEIGIIGKEITNSAQVQFYQPPPFHTEGYLDSHYSGSTIFLVNIEPSSAKNTSMSLSTLDTLNPNANWSGILNLEADWHAYEIRYKENGAWFGINLDSYKTFSVHAKVLNYNVHTNSYIDTGFPIESTPLLGAQLLSVGPDKLLVCQNKKDNPNYPSKIYFYQDRGQWLDLNTHENPITTCHFSTSGTQAHPVKDLDPTFIDNIWIYHLEPPNKS